jgi:hypothetical protein
VATAPIASCGIFNANRDIVEVVREIADAMEVAASLARAPDPQPLSEE